MHSWSNGTNIKCMDIVSHMSMYKSIIEHYKNVITEFRQVKVIRPTNEVFVANLFLTYLGPWWNLLHAQKGTNSFTFWLMLNDI